MASLTAARAKGSFDFNYLMFSDVHLGAGLVTHVRPWANGWRHQCTEVDEAIASCLDHYDGHRPEGKPWRLVIAGDFVDFIGMSLPPPDEDLPSGVTDEERAHGLGSAADHAVRKLRAAADLHHVAFSAIARFLASGNELVVVRGNHDVDFHWRAVRRAFVDLLHEHGPAHVRRVSLRGRVRFCPWFYYEPDLLYVEHGHEFDPMCSYGDPLSPVCPRDPRRIRWSPSDVMLRYVARPTPGLSTTDHEQGTVASYLRLAASLGIGGGVRLVYRFCRATLRLAQDSIAHERRPPSAAPARLRRMAAYARRFRVGDDVVRAMAGLYATPAGTTLVGLAGRLYLDRLAMLSVAACSALAALTIAFGTGWGVGMGAFAIMLALFSGRTPSRTENPALEMERGAARIAALFPTRYVIMGHTHEPVLAPLEGGLGGRPSATYVNLGHWGQDDLPEDRPSHCTRPPCSHLVVLTARDGVRAELLRWDAQQGARPLSPARARPAAVATPEPAPALV